MTVKEFNTELYPKISHAKAFILNLDHAMQKAGRKAAEQVEMIGWSQEIKNFIVDAIDCYEKELRDRIICENKIESASHIKEV